MRIAIATWSYDEHQGISRCVVELAARLSLEHEVHVFAAEIAADVRPGIELHRVELRYPQVHLNEYDFYLRAGRALRAGGFDVVHAHFPVGCPTDVYTCHGLARMALRTFRGFPPAGSVDVPLSRMLRWYIQVPLHSLAVRRRRPQLCAVSRKVARELAEESGRPLEQIEVVANGVDLTRFRPEIGAGLRQEARRRLGLADTDFALLWVGNHLRHKGMRHAIATLEKLPESAVLLAVGADAPGNMPELAPAFERLRASGRLRFLAVDAQIEPYYAAADALLFPSLYESFGLVVLEAMAIGLPVVTARSVAFADESIVDGVNGFVVDDPWDSDGMAGRVRRLMGDAALRASIAEAGWKTAQHFTWDAYCAAYQRLYAGALLPRQSSRGRPHAV